MLLSRSAELPELIHRRENIHSIRLRLLNCYTVYVAIQDV